jgi:hypothetical protein
MKTPVITRRTVNSKKQSPGAGAQARSLGLGGGSLRFWQRMLGAAFFCLILVGVALFRALPAPDRQFELSPPVSRATDHSLNHYLQSGQWRADVRTLASLFHYLVTPDAVAATNRAVMPA